MYPYSLNFEDERLENIENALDDKMNPKEIEVEEFNPARAPFGGFNPFFPNDDDNDYERPRPNRPGSNAPMGPPPQYIPEKRSGGASLYAVDPRAIKGCQGNFTYVWLRNGRSFWMYITFVGRQSVSGYRYSRFGWTYSGIDLQSIESFSCQRF